MTKTMKFLSMAALALVGAIVTGCSGDDSMIEEPQQPVNPKNVVTLTATVGFDEGAEARGITRALAADGTKTFAAGEQLALIYQNTSGSTVKAVSAALPEGEYGSTANFTFELEDPDKTKSITYIYPAVMAKDDGTVNNDALNSQDGTLATLASNLDLATYTAAWNGASLPTGTLNNQLAILALTLKDETGTSDITSSITGLTLNDGTYSYAVSRSAAAGPIYVAIHPTASASIEVTATDGNFSYTKSLTSKTYEANNGYNLSWRMVFDALSSPLTFEAKTAGATVTFTKGSSITTLNNIEYNVYDGKGWQSYTYGTGITLTNVGDKISFRGDNDAYATTTSSGNFSKISCSDDCYIYGNIMSLVNSTNYANAKTLTGNYAFCNLFYYNTHIVNHPSKTLVLPATTLANHCYQNMFKGCTSLTTAPMLPAETLTTSCYYGMFQDCTSLTTAPALPAETLTTSCYYGMFQGCTSLTTAPALPAETLAENCYQNMFQNCTSLAAAPALPAMTLQKNCYPNMFYGCTSLTAAPVLPATTLQSYCYQNMFKGCTNLSSVTCLATTNIKALNCYDWLNGVAATGTFTTPSSTSWSTGSSGIPSGWTRLNAQ